MRAKVTDVTDAHEQKVASNYLLLPAQNTFYVLFNYVEGEVRPRAGVETRALTEDDGVGRTRAQKDNECISKLGRAGGRSLGGKKTISHGLRKREG